MLASLRLSSLSIIWRTICIVSTLMVFSYVFFDVLDLDGSDFPLRQYPIKGVALVQNVTPAVERFYYPDLARLPRNATPLSTADQTASILMQRAEMLRPSVRDPSLGRHYRVGLPRSSPSDSSASD